MKKFLLINILILCVSFAFAQQHKIITGKVVCCDYNYYKWDSYCESEELTGVTVMVIDGTPTPKFGTVTDIDGYFELGFDLEKLNLENDTIKIEFSYYGFKDKIYTIAKNDVEENIKICLEEIEPEIEVKEHKDYSYYPTRREPQNATEIFKTLPEIVEEFKGVQVQPLMHPNMKKLNKKKKN